MIELNKIIENFSNCAREHHRFTLEGNWRMANLQAKKINELFEMIKELRDEGRNELLKLTDSGSDEVASMAAAYSMRFNPEKSLTTFQRIMKKNIPLLSSGAQYAIENWKNKEWYIDQ